MLVACGGASIRDTHKPEFAGREVNGGDEFHKEFIYGAEFLGSHVPVVDGGAFSGFLVKEPPQFAHGGKESTVGEGGGIQVRALIGMEEASEGGEGEFFLTRGESPEDNFYREPEIAMGIVGGVAEGAAAQTAEGIAGGVIFPCRMVTVS